MRNSIKILLADDHQLFRQGLSSLIKEIEDLELIGEVADGVHLMRFLELQMPDVLLLDLRMPKMDGIMAYKKLHEKYPLLKVIVLSMEEDELLIHELMVDGINSFMPKDTDIEELAAVIRLVKAKGFYFTEKIKEITRRAIERESQTKSITERQKEILKLICQGDTHKVIADKLNIKMRTVDFHKSNLYQRSGARNNAELALYAIKNGLIKISELK